MSIRFASPFIALLVGLCLHASSALAELSVEATQAKGAPNTDVEVSLKVSGVVDDIYGYQFNLFWDPAALEFNGYSNTADDDLDPLNRSSVYSLLGSGSAVIEWVSDGTPVSFASEQSITASFHILSSAAPGSTWGISFGDEEGPSVLIGPDLIDPPYVNEIRFFSVSQGNLPMQVTVLPTSPVPEPAEISMMLAGLGIMALVLRRRRNQG